MFWEFHDFRVERVDYVAADDRIDLYLGYDTYEFGVLLRFVGGVYMNFAPGYEYLADWLMGTLLEVDDRGRILWVSDEGVDTQTLLELGDDDQVVWAPAKSINTDYLLKGVMWITSSKLYYTMIDAEAHPMPIPDDIIHQEFTTYDYKLGKYVEGSRDFRPKRCHTQQGDDSC